MAECSEAKQGWITQNLPGYVTLFLLHILYARSDQNESTIDKHVNHIYLAVGD